MKKIIVLILLFSTILFSQDHKFKKFDFLIAFQPGMEMNFEKNYNNASPDKSYYESSSINFRLTYIF